MHWYEYAGMWLGLLWLFCMIVRVPAIVMDTRLFWRSLKALQYQGNHSRLTVFRFVLPGIIGAPVMLWMDGLDALRVTAASSVYQVAIELCCNYGPDQPFPEPDEPEAPEEDRHGATPYFRALSSDTEVG